MKRIVLILLMVCVSGLTYAQQEFSITTGMNYSSVSSINSTNPDAVLGATGGVALKYYWGDLGWFIKPALQYSQEGWLHQRLDYINLPVIAGFDFTDDFNFNLGIQYGYLVGGLNDPSGFVDRSNFAFITGFEFYPAKFLDVGLRFTKGVKNIINENPDLVIKDARTYTIQFYFGFNLSKKD